MIRAFLSHSAKRLFRSSSAGKDIAMRITLGVFTLFIVAYALTFGFFLERIIVNKLNQTDPVGFLNGLLIYYFAGEVLIRYFFQSLPAWDIQPYLHLPIPRTRIINFLLCRSLLHFLNIFVFLLFTPFALGAVANSYGLMQACMWLLSLWLFSMMLHFVVILVKQTVAHSVWGPVIFVALAALSIAHNRNWFQFSGISEIAFNNFQNGFRNVIVLLSLVVLLYFVTFRRFIGKLYPDELNVHEAQTFHTADVGFLQKLGLIGLWINIELKLIFRNRRSREVFFLHVMIFFAVFIVWYQKRDTQIGFHFLLGLFSSGCFTGNYGQYLYGWQAHHFDLTLTQPTPIRFFVESKYWLLTFIIVLWFIVSMPFVYFGWHFLLVTLVCSLFNIGVGLFIIMNMSMWGARKIDLTHKGTLNYEGAGAAQWLMGIPLFLIPSLLFFPLSLAGYPTTGLVVVGGAGLLGIIFHKKLIKTTTRRLYHLRHVMAANFKRY